MTSRTTKVAGVAIGLACFIAPTALVTTDAHASSTTPVLVVNDSGGGTWSLRPTGASHGTQNFAGTDLVAPQGCTYDATASKTNVPGSGTWSWTFSATLVSGPCVDWLRFVGTGIGTITGTYTNPFESGSFSGTVVKGPGAP